MDILVSPARTLRGTLTVAADKSISHRAFLLAALADGSSRIANALDGDDVRATIHILTQLGADIQQDGSAHIIRSCPLRAPTEWLDCGNSGTGMRLLMGVLSGQNIAATLTGDASLSARPMRRVSEPLNSMGANITTANNGTPPVHIAAHKGLKGQAITLPVASAQIKSALLFAGLGGEGVLDIAEPGISRDHTERLFETAGIALTTTHTNTDTETRTSHRMVSGQNPRGVDITVPSDISAAAFFMVAASLHPNAEICLPAVGTNPTRDGVVRVLQAMGANITLENARLLGHEPVADIIVKSSALTGMDIPADWVTNAMDEFPVLFVAAAFARGTTRVRRAHELRVKESDRIARMAEILQAFGVECTVYPDGMDVVGGTPRAPSVPIQTHHDHRLGMATAVAATLLDAQGHNPTAHKQNNAAPHAVRILDAETIQSSFPTFIATARQAGFHITTA